MALPARLALCSILLAVNAGAVAESRNPAPAGPASLAAPSHAAPSPAAPSPAAIGPVMSESKFLGALYSEIEKHTPIETTLGDGEVTASFHVNAAGRVDKVVIDKTSSPAHADAVKKILGAVVAPPPPGGSMDVGQTFRFHKSEPDDSVAPSAPAPAPETSKPAPAAPAR